MEKMPFTFHLSNDFPLEDRKKVNTIKPPLSLFRDLGTYVII